MHKREQKKKTCSKGENTRETNNMFHQKNKLKKGPIVFLHWSLNNGIFTWYTHNLYEKLDVIMVHGHKCKWMCVSEWVHKICLFMKRSSWTTQCVCEWVSKVKVGIWRSERERESESEREKIHGFFMAFHGACFINTRWKKKLGKGLVVGTTLKDTHTRQT